MNTNRVSPGLTLWQYILSDLARYWTPEHQSYLVCLLMYHGPLASISYRIGHWIFTHPSHVPVLDFLARGIFVVANRIVEIMTGISIAPRATIGPGLYIGHFGCIFIGEGVVMGSNCNISQGVTVGIAGRGSKRGSPLIGDRVYVAPGAKVIGPIHIGNDVAIGSNAVVTKTLPDRALAVGIPASVISYEGSFEFIIYRGMETDEDRAQSLACREVCQASATRIAEAL